MSHSDGETVRWRGSVLAISILVVLAMVGESLVPALAEAKPKPGPGHLRLYSESRLDPHQADRSQRSRGGVHGQVVGGRTVPQGKFTFMAFVEVETEFGFFQCGGSLIDPSFVLTAAHCVTDDDGIAFEEGAFGIGVGKADLNALQPGNIRGVEVVSPHPAYDPLTFENDVAVLKLDEPVPSSIAQLLPMVGPDETRFDGPGQASVVTGWGTTSSGGDTSDRLLEADLSVVSDSSCAEAYAGTETEFIQSVMICAALQGRDSCQGDSGGPLMAKEVIGHKVKKGKKKKHRKRRKKKIPIIAVTQMGIVSFGIGCADPNFPGVYTRVSAPGINDFIVETVNG